MIHSVFILLIFTLYARVVYSFKIDFTQRHALYIELHLGTAIYPERSTSFILGGEASFINLHKYTMRTGTYENLLYDFGSKTRHLSIGPEVDLGFGIDGGCPLSSCDQILSHGYELCALFTNGWF